MLNDFTKTGEPISVNFRQLVSWFSGSERATHLIHSYPAKLLMHIPYFFLANSILSQEGDLVLDPFCGSGTVLLEALLSNRIALGTDTNPLAQLISRVKTTFIPIDELRKSLDDLMALIPAVPSIKEPDVVNINYWFYPEIIRQLMCISEAISQIENPLHRDFYFVCFSNIVRRVSLADPRIAVPVRLRTDKYPIGHPIKDKVNILLEKLKTVNVKNVFIEIVNTNIDRMSSMKSLLGNFTQSATVLAHDVRKLTSLCISEQPTFKLHKESVQLMITSPPYAGAQKYIRSSSLNLGWLELCQSSSLTQYECLTIGREHYKKSQYKERILTGIKSADDSLEVISRINPLRAHIAATYLLEMKDVIGQFYYIIRPGGYLVLVVGNNHVCGKEFNTKEYLKILCREVGFTLVLELVDDIRSRGLMTKRNKTANIISREWVLLFQRS